MKNDYATAMRRALRTTRATEPGAATAIIQSALTSAGLMPATAGPENGCGPCADTAARTYAAPSFDLSAFGQSMKDGPMAGFMSGLAPGVADGLATGLGRGKSAANPTVPAGASYSSRSYSGVSGARDYRLFVPSPRDDAPRGLVVMLHGCTQSPDDFAVGTRMNIVAERENLIVAYPGQTSQHNAQSCWNWFRPGDQIRGGGEAEILAGIARDLAQDYDLGHRVYVAGLSAGGAMAAILAQTHPDVFAAAGVHSGLPAGSASDVGSAFAAMRGQGAVTGQTAQIPVIAFHGTADHTVAPANARRIVTGSGVETTHSGNGRKWTRETTRTPGPPSELWLIEGAGHAWFGGDPAGSYADPTGPDASSEMVRFFLNIGETT